MDDGTYNKPGVRIATNNFSYAEHLVLIKLLLLKYNIVATIHKNASQYQLYIKVESMPILIDLVLPYFHKSMLYKLGK